MGGKPSAAICTFSGRMFDVANPDPKLLAIEDIAHALSNQCRFTGHVRTFYSVGEHSVRASYIDPTLTTLMHDATEAYLIDLARPIKHATPLGAIFRELEDTLWRCIATRYNLPLVIPAATHRADNIMLLTEKRDLMNDPKEMTEYKRTWVVGDIDPLPEKIIPNERTAQTELTFIKRFFELGGSEWQREQN